MQASRIGLEIIRDRAGSIVANTEVQLFHYYFDDEREIA
jgi:hypothetical protein